MRIIISPAKQMKMVDGLPPQGIPVQVDKARQVMAWMKARSLDELQSLWKCSDKLAAEAYDLTCDLTLDKPGTPAVLAYDGIAFKYMAPDVFSNGEFSYVQEHLRILSAFYGVLRPMDAIEPYRLELQHRAGVAGEKDLYAFWGASLYEEVMRENPDRVIVNLASKEYSKAIERYLRLEDAFVTCTFAEESKGKLVSKGVYCKMARGEMVRYMATRGVTRPEQLRDFDSPVWEYREELSSEREYLFLRRKDRSSLS